MTHRTSGIKRIYSTCGGRWQLALLLAVLCMGATLLLTKVTFLNNDDTNILYALAGYRTGTPYPTHRFINVLLGRCISTLYTALPAVPWWCMYQLAAICASLTVIYACVLELGARAGLPIWGAVALCAVLYLTVFCYAVTWLTFTLTAGLLGTAGCALLLSAGFTAQENAPRRYRAAFALLLLVLCFLTRNSSGYSMLCFFFAALLFAILKSERKGRIAVICYAACCLAVAFAVVRINDWGVRRYNPADYPAFEAARGHFIDYPHAAYADDPAFFERLGWDETVYDLADNLCYLDPSVNAETMQQAAEYRLDAEAGIFSKLGATLAYGELYFRGSGVSQYMLVIPALLTIWLAAAYIWARRGRRADRANAEKTFRRGIKELIVGLAVAAGAFLLCFYLCYAGRFPVRTFMLIAIPTTVVECLLLLRMWGETGGIDGILCASGGDTRKNGYFLRLIVVVVSLAAVLWSAVMSGRTLLSYDKSALAAQNAAAERYVMAHADDVYLTDVTSVENVGAWTVYPGQKPVNLVDWGGTGMHSGWKQEQLAINGLVPFTGDIFRQANVYFLTRQDSDKLEMLTAYLKKHFGAAGHTLVEVVPDGGDLAVYRFEFLQ